MANPLRRRHRIYLSLTVLLAATPPVLAAGPACPLPGQKDMLIARLYFGEAIPGREPLTGEEWRGFLSQTLTPRFPAGFTVYDAYGQWSDTKTRAIARENAKVIEIVAPDTQAFRKNIADIAAAYRKQFQQESVGIVTSEGCAEF